MLHILTLSSLFPDATRPGFGGFVARQTRALADHPAVQVRVIAPVGVPPWPARLHPRYRALAGLPLAEDWNGLAVWRPRFRSLPGTNGRNAVKTMARTLLPLVRQLHAQQPIDVIDAEFFFPDGPVAMRIADAMELPFSIKARGSDIHYWGHQPHAAEEIRAAGCAADGLLAVSAAMKADMMALGMPEQRIRVHYTGIDLERFVPGDRAAAKAALGVTGPLIAAVGALIPLKGHALLIDALAQLPGATLMLAGSGPDRQRLEARARAGGVADRVRFLGQVDHGAMPGLLAAADIMALASEAEGLANVWVEALACGTPVVIPDVGGAREIITSEAAGRLAPRTPDGFARAMAALIADPPAAPLVRQNAERFSWARNSRELFDHLSAIKR